MEIKLNKKTRNTTYRKDLTGQTFGYLTPLYWEKGKGWTCQCKCGNTITVSTAYLTTGHTTSCGCKKHMTKNIKNMLGFENDYLKVVGQEEKVKGKYPKWICLCKTCGRTFHLEGKHIRLYDLQSCGCVHSKGEQKIIKLLEENNIQYSKEYTFKDLKGIHGGSLRFDFAIFIDNKLSHLIEYNGKQHYDRPGGKWADGFDICQMHDKLKMQYCKDHNIELRIIKYDQDFSFKDLI